MITKPAVKILLIQVNKLLAHRNNLQLNHFLWLRLVVYTQKVVNKQIFQLPALSNIELLVLIMRIILHIYRKYHMYYSYHGFGTAKKSRKPITKYFR